MSKQYPIIGHHSSVVLTMSVINDYGMGLAVVVDEKKKYLGLITDGDIRRAIIGGLSPQDQIEGIVNKKAIFGRIDQDRKSLIQKLSLDLKAIPLVDQNDNFVELLQYKDLNIPAAKPGLHGNELLYLTDCVLSNWISSQGEYVDRFEKSFADFIGTKYALSCSNGTAALHLALLAGGIEKGDEVIVPSFTWISTANAVRYIGATPIFADINNETLNLDYKSLKDLVSSKTKAIIPVHLYGQPAEMSELSEFCSERNILLIEDAAEAHGAKIGENLVGSLGDMGCFSFFGNKIITTGEGGMVTTDNEVFFNKMKKYRDHGKSDNDPYWHDVVGYNYRMTNMQAAVGLAQMERVEEILSDKLRIAKLFKENFLDTNLILPPDLEWSENIHWLYCVRIPSFQDNEKNRVVRDKIINHLEINSIGARKFFYPIHLMPPYKGSSSVLPVTEEVSARGICLPSYYGMKEDEIKTISSLLIESLSRHG